MRGGGEAARADEEEGRIERGGDGERGRRGDRLVIDARNPQSAIPSPVA
jgi:hypothetical protein